MIKQRGSVIIIVLWTAVLLTVLVTAMAAQVRLSAQTVMNNHESATQWSALMATVRQAEAEIMYEFMPDPIGEQLPTNAEGELREQRYRFNGQSLELAYAQEPDIVVRVYNHSGKINLTRIRRQRMRAILEKRLGGPQAADQDRVDELLAAWVDWTDLNELIDPSGDGAENDYYESLEPGFTPRNNPELDTVEELLLVRGFAEVFAGVNLDAAFTVHGNEQSINLNLATREAMQLLPGLTDELIERIIAFREYEDINNRQEIAEIIPYENLLELTSWLGNSYSTHYSVFAYPAVELEAAAADAAPQWDNPDPVTRAYMEIIEVRSYDSLPRVLKVEPYGRLPDTAPARVALEDLPFVL